MTPFLSGPGPRSPLLVAIGGALLLAGFLTLRRDPDRIDGRAEGALETTAPTDRLAADRREVREALVRTATQIAGLAWEWYLRPAAFGGGDGRWDGLALAHLGYNADAAGYFRTTDGAFALRPEANGIAVVAENERLDVQAVVAVRTTAGGSGLQLVVDGQPVEGMPVPAPRPASGPGTYEQLQTEADRLADYVAMVLEREPADGDVLRGRSRPAVTLRDLHVEVGADGAFVSPAGPLRLSWETRNRAVITGRDAQGHEVRAVAVLADPPPPSSGGSISPE